jgi:tetratricopeptide (TPR) repeat protein
MKPLHYLLLAAIMAAGLAGSILLIPTDSDLSLMYFRGHQYENARPLYEKRLAAGDRSADVVMPLAELYVQSGEVGRAVNLLQQFGTAAGDRLDLFQRVATFQKYGQQMQEYLYTLEAINRIGSSEDALRELANQYRYANQNAKLIPALQTLLARYPGEPAEYLELANLLAVGGRLAGAAGVLERFESRYPQEVRPATVEFLVSVLLDSAQPLRALERAARWVDGHRDSGGVARLAMLLRTKGQPALARRLLEPFEPAIDGDPVLLAEWVEQQVEGNRAGEAFERLDRLRRRNLLPDDLTEPFLDLALARGEVALAIEVAEKHGVHGLSETLLGMLAERALAADREAFAYRLEAALGDGFLRNRPLLAARLAYARGDRREAARRLELAEADPKLSDSDRLAVASLDVTLGRPAPAAAQLARIRIEVAPEDLLLETARLYLTVGKPGEGAGRFDGLRARRSSAAVDRAWALVAAGAGRGPEVARWIQAAPAGSISEPLLRDLYFLAQDHKQANLALAASERLFREHAGDANRLTLANALTAAGQPLDALAQVRVLLAHGHAPGVEEAYTAALLGAIRGAPGGAAEALQAELRSFWTAQLGRPGEDERQQLDLIYGLLELNAWDAALPHLETLARRRSELVPLYIETAAKSSHPQDAVAFLESDLARQDLSPETREARVYALIEHGGLAEALPYVRQLAATLPNWMAAYEDALNKLGRTSELVDFWRNRLAGGALSAEEKRAIGFKLIDAGRVEWARSVFADLAGAAPPNHADVAELLFLWGPKPGSEALDWLEERARRANPADRAAWLSLLLDAGAPDRVAAIASASLPPAGQGGALLEVYLRALGELHQMDRLAGAVAREAGATADMERLRKLAKLARDAGGMAAEPVYSRLLALDPGDPEALHWLGVFAYRQARYSVAERSFGALLADSEGGWDDNFYAAEMLWRKGSRSEARAYYGRALRLIEGMPPPPQEARTAHAQALFRSGSLERALGEYRTLVAAAPRNGDLRADFGAMLLEARLYEEAEDVLSGGVDSGGTRMALLRVQLLSATTRRSDALRLIHDLTEANPDMASVVAALGLVEQDVGRTRRAQDLFDRAIEMDPDNEDLRQYQAALEQEREGSFSAEGESRRIQGAQSEDLVRILGERLLSRSWRFQFAMDQDSASISNLRYADGRIGPFDGVLRRGEAALEWESDDGTRVKGSLFTGNSTIGGGVAVTKPDPNGSFTIQLDLNRPNWDIAETLAEHGVRDRVEVRREITLGPRVSVAVGAAANRYSLPGMPGAAESVSAAGDASLRLLRQPQIALGYSFDGEYLLSTKTLSEAATGMFQPLPLVSREVHAASVRFAKQLTRGWRVEGSGGMAVDRLGGSAPFWTAAVSYDASRHFGLKLDYDRRLYTLDTSRIVTSFRVNLLWRF